MNIFPNVFEEIDKIEARDEDNVPYPRFGCLLDTDSIVFLQNNSFEQQLLQLISLLSIPRSKLLKKDISEQSFKDYSNILVEVSVYFLYWVETAVFIFRALDFDDDIEWAYHAKDLFNEVEKEVINASSIFSNFIEKASDSIFQESSDSNSINLKSQEISQGWTFVKKFLGFIKYQIEISKEWVDCIEILNQINQELKKCDVLVFEIKERTLDIPSISHQFMEFISLESFVKDVFDDEKIGTLEEINSTDILNKWNRNCQNFIFQVYEKIKPLETSLIFFKLRIEYFKEKALELFPTAIHDIEQRRHSLEIKCKKLQDNFSSVKRKFQEDKWILVFSYVNKQATDIMDSLELEIQKFNTSSPITKKVTESYKTYKVKRDSYAIIRIITLIEWGVWNKLTNSSQVIEGYNTLYERWKNLNKNIIKIDNIVLENDTSSKDSEKNTESVVNDSESVISKSVKSCTIPKTPQFPIKYCSLIPVSKNKRRPLLYDMLKVKSKIQSTPRNLHYPSYVYSTCFTNHSDNINLSKKSSISSFTEDTPIQLSKLKIFPAIMEQTRMSNKVTSHLSLKLTPTKNTPSSKNNPNSKNSPNLKNSPNSKNSPSSKSKILISGLGVSRASPLQHTVSTEQISSRNSNIKLTKYKENNSSFSNIPRPSFQKISCFSVLGNQNSSIKMVSTQKNIFA
ncbi:uncharacterized protein T551_01676 [Pneumocystis jirovecii RU7]|uniref:Karyogamy protein n=1 Tax=Pneumocystis jirovecii (strain RU7) TaxID=1408657 RepID=A0A0W4ZPU2_PNEJ7|nr:uncharacterized protein T551_01676 [Pneumocystis jirovecii RU7]KTW30393.1 hypothetical protein T551_01676 [Pneumocystis jirovecii RU7]